MRAIEPGSLRPIVAARNMTFVSFSWVVGPGSESGWAASATDVESRTTGAGANILAVKPTVLATIDSRLVLASVVARKDWGAKGYGCAL